MNIKASFNGVPLKRLTGIHAFGDLTYDRACMLELAFPGELDSDRGGPEVELAGRIPAAARSPAARLLRIEDAYGLTPKLLGCPVKKCEVWISPRLPPLRSTLR